MTRTETIAAVYPKILEATLDAFRETYNGEIGEHVLLDHGWDSLDLIEIVMDIEDSLDLEIQDDFIDTVLPDSSEVEKLTTKDLIDLFLNKLTDEKLTALAAHLDSPGTDRLAIDLPTK